MKKVLLTSTALVMVAGMAAADGHTGVSVSGGAVAGFKYDEDAANETVLHYELDFGVSGAGETDAGLAFGASFDLDLDDEDDAAEIDDAEIFISGTFGTLTVGDGPDIATDPMGFSDPGFDGIGVDDDAEVFKDIGDANVHYEYNTGSLTFAVTGSVPDGDEDDSGDYALYVAYGFGDITLELGYATDDEGNATLGDDADALSLGVSGSAGAVSYSVFYHTAEGDTFEADGYGASVSFDAGSGVTVVIAAGATDVDTDDTDYGIGFEYDLGGGAAIAGAVGRVGSLGDARTVADLGMTFSF
ncbi:MAG: porin [Pseudomonadota bacterium]